MSGCSEFGNGNGWTGEKVKILNYSILTYSSVEGNITNGFVYSEDAKFYKINGTAKNIAGETLEKVTIIIKFFDSKNTFLREESTPVYDIKDYESWEFEIIYLSSWDYFEIVDHIEFDISWK